MSQRIVLGRTVAVVLGTAMLCGFPAVGAAIAVPSASPSATWHFGENAINAGSRPTLSFRARSATHAVVGRQPYRYVVSAVRAGAPQRLNSALPQPGYGKGAGYCAGYPGGVTSSYSFEDVYACRGTTTGATTFDNPGSGIDAWQCVELSARFMWAMYGIWAGPGSGVLDGADLVSVVHSHDPKTAVGTPGPGSVPAPGDVISLGPGGAVDPVSGHTAVVIASNVSTGQFTVMSENDPDGTVGEQTAKVDLSGGHNGRVNFDGNGWTTASWLKLAAPSSDLDPGRVNTLQSVDARSAGDVWAAGFYCTGCDQLGNVDQTLILHWNGQSWSRIASPDPEQGNDLNGISADSATDAWAVGSQCAPGCDKGVPYPLILHWDGHAWSQVPGPASVTGFLSGVTAISPTDAWAVGDDGLGDNVILHWNGARWTRVRSPDPGAQGTQSLFAVSAVSATDAWAVGDYCAGTCAGNTWPTLILHWNGTNWSHVPSPSPRAFNSLQAITAVSKTDAWAGGQAGTNDDGLMLHWNGSTWKVVKTPFSGYVQGISASSVNHAWAIGNGPVFLHWNGKTKKWSAVVIPNHAPETLFSGVSTNSASDAWAVGEFCGARCSGNSPRFRILIIHWNGTTWSRK